MDTKTCSKCKATRPVGDFHFRNKSKGIRRSHCRFCQQKAMKSHYQGNKDYYISRAKNRYRRCRSENEAHLAEYLKHHPCVDCGEADIRVLQFDHVRGQKSDSICNMLRNGYSWDGLQNEIEKCDVRCANCHLKRTSAEGGYWRLNHL